MTQTEHPGSRQLVICCDGTNNTLTGRQTDTNVLQLFEQLATQNDASQLLYYDPGVGAPDGLPSIGIGDWISRKWERLSGLASGRGVFENIGMAYQFLANHYQPGDQIFLFGFSRGAFTVRCVAGMINLFGLVRSEHAVLLPTLLRVYFAKVSTDGIESGQAPGSAPLTRGEVAAQIRESFTSVAGRHAEVHFVGVWDTVASVGLPPFSLQISSSATIKGKCFRHVRQALSLDEHRWPFLPRVFSEDNFGSADAPQSLTQLWFRGVHCDVGGGYPLAETGLSSAALGWMIDEACQCGLRCPVSPPKVPSEPIWRVHDTMFRVALWAVAGMCVRDSCAALGTNGRGIAVTAVAHPSVAAARPDSVWDHPRGLRLGLVLLAVTAGLLWAVGCRLATAASGDPLLPLSIIGSAILVPGMAQDRLLQLDLHALRHALLLALLALPFATALLALPVSRALARAVGWRQVGVRRPWFAVLGGALALALTASVVAQSTGVLSTLCRPGGAMQAVVLWSCSLAGWLAVVGLAGCLLLLFAGLKKGPR